QHALQWTNQVFPACLNMPANIVAWNPQVSGGIATLQQAAAQLQSQPSNSQLLTAVQSNARSLLTLVTGYTGQVSALAQSLQAFAQALQGDQTAAVQTIGTLQQQIGADNAQLASLYGKLHKLQNATCPSASAISQCSQQIAQVQGQISGEQSALGTY